MTLDFKQGDRVTWPHREGRSGGRRTVISHGVVTDLDDGGVHVELDIPANGTTRLYAGKSELCFETERCHYCKEWFPKPVHLHHSEDECV